MVVSVVRTRFGVAMKKITATIGSANSHPRLWPIRAIPASRTAAPTNSPRSAAEVSRRDPSTTQGQNADDHSAAFALA